MSASGSAKRLVRILSLAIVAVLWTLTASAQSGPALSTKTPTDGTFGGTLFVTLPIVNSGSMTAGSVQVTSVTLSTATLLTALPLAVGDLAPAATFGVNLNFNASSLTAAKNYLLTLRGIYKTPSGTFGFALNRFISYGNSGPFAHPPNPLTVTPTLDTAHSVGQTISAANGGTITATGADGSVFTLTIPANALVSDELITMTPLSAVGNLPVSGGLLAGVQLSPDGLYFSSRLRSPFSRR